MINKKDIEEKVSQRFSMVPVKENYGENQALVHIASVAPEYLEHLKSFAVSIPLSLLESLEKDVEGMKTIIRQNELDTHKHSYFAKTGHNSAIGEVLSLIKQYKEQLK